MSTTPTKRRPLLFISHKHADSKIADEIRNFVTMQSGGRVDVFQSSSPWAEAPKAGRNLNSQLREVLWKTSVLILLYTTPEQDWNYCMWECGVATNPQSPYTKIILFQCTDSSPSLFSDQVNINVRNPADIQNFTNDFLTASDFFPGFTEPITQFQPKGREVVNAAATLSKQLEPVLPPVRIDPTDEWLVYPYLQFELRFPQIDEIRAAMGEGQTQKTNDIIKKGCIISGADQYAEVLFGVPSFERETTFLQLIERWRRKFPSSKSLWVETLCTQILAGAMWEIPPRIWTLMQGFSDNTWYAPVLNRIRRIPSNQCMQFDIFFYKFDIDAQKNIIQIQVPVD